jgi:hypothetical protein
MKAQDMTQRDLVELALAIVREKERRHEKTELARLRRERFDHIENEASERRARENGYSNFSALRERNSLLLSQTNIQAKLIQELRDEIAALIAAGKNPPEAPT